MRGAFRFAAGNRSSVQNGLLRKTSSRTGRSNDRFGYVLVVRSAASRQASAIAKEAKPAPTTGCTQARALRTPAFVNSDQLAQARSEERRVGKAWCIK